MTDHNADVDAVLAALARLQAMARTPSDHECSAGATAAFERLRAALPVDDADDLDMADGVAVWEVAA